MIRTPDADICLIVEGAYPYVTGGVSSWVLDLVRAQPHLAFHIVALKPDDQPLPHRLPLADNIVGMTEIGLAIPPSRRAMTLPAAEAHAIGEALQSLWQGGGIAALGRLIGILHRLDGPIDPAGLLGARTLFDTIITQYGQMAPAASFNHFFWAWRTLAGGLLSVLAAPLPRASVYHAVSTGYAGLLAARAHIETARPTMLTEHGLYLVERRIEIMMAGWLALEVDTGLSLATGTRDLKDLWMDAFAGYATACYEASDPIIALYAANAEAQVKLGASLARARVIPNGVDVARFGRIRRRPGPPTAALIGRVVPIKDVKGFLRAAALTRRTLPEARFLVIGPLDEDPAYATECVALARSLGLDEAVEFTGRIDIDTRLGEVDVVVLTSLSEAQPFAILEAGAAGIPAIAPDIGCCRELIEGMAGAGELPGGIVTPLADPVSTVKAMTTLLGDAPARVRAGAALKARIADQYQRDQVAAAYRDVYHGLIARTDRAAA